MKKLLIVYGTTEGQTGKIARYLEERFSARGLHVTLCNSAEEQPEVTEFDAVILAGSLHMEKLQTALIDYAAKHKREIEAVPNALIMVSLSAADMDAEAKTGLDSCVNAFIESSGWTPSRVEHVAGALKYVEYNFFKRFILKQISKSKGGSTDTTQDHEYTDWAKLDLFVQEFLKSTN